jgi:hypothetical protein
MSYNAIDISSNSLNISGENCPLETTNEAGKEPRGPSLLTPTLTLGQEAPPCPQDWDPIILSKAHIPMGC